MDIENEVGNTENQPFFSVIIPVYNRAHSIVKAIDSLFLQSYQNFEVIVVDDASTDNTKEIVTAIQNPKLKFVQNDSNQERCITRNRGISLARGQYICFLDSDDYHLPNHLELIHKEIQQQNKPVAFFFTNAWDEDSEGNRMERCCPEFEKFDAYTYFLHYTVNPQRWSVHKSIFEKIQFDNKILICEDMDTSLRILNAGYPVFQIKERTTVYVAAADSFTMSDKNKAEKELFYLKKIFSRPELKGKLSGKECRRLISMCHFHLVIKATAENRRLQVFTHAAKSFFLYPKGYNGKTNKILLVSCLYSIPLVGIILKSIKRII